MQAAAPTSTTNTTATPPLPWWTRMIAKCLSIIAGLLSILLAVVALVTVNPNCMVAALLQLFIGFMTIAFEAPVCCMCIECIAKIADFSESRSYWQKSLLYMLSGLIPIVICFELSTLFGSGMILLSGIVYGMMAIGKRGSNADDNTIGGNDSHVDAWDPNIRTNMPPTITTTTTSYNQP